MSREDEVRRSADRACSQVLNEISTTDKHDIRGRDPRLLLVGEMEPPAFQPGIFSFHVHERHHDCGIPVVTPRW